MKILLTHPDATSKLMGIVGRERVKYIYNTTITDKKELPKLTLGGYRMHLVSDEEAPQVGGVVSVSPFGRLYNHILRRNDRPI